MFPSVIDYFLWIGLFIGLLAGYGLHHISRQCKFSKFVQREEQVSLVEQRFTVRFGIFLLILSLILLILLCGIALHFNVRMEAVAVIISLSIINALLVLGANIFLAKIFARRKS